MPIDSGSPRWQLKKLTELGELNRGRSRHRPRHAPHLYGGPYPFIQTGDVKASGGRISSYQQTYSEAGLAQSRLWPAGTLCITIAANIAETGILDFPACFPDSIVGFVADSSVCNVRFVEYLFRGIRNQIQFEASEGGTVQDNINVATLDRLRIPIPEKRVQDALAEALGALDDKIELNRRMNQTLESMARTIFRSWFVDFDPVVAKAEGRQPFGMSAEVATLFPDRFVESAIGPVPQGWPVRSIDEILELNPIRSLRKGDTAPYLEMANLPKTQARVADWEFRAFSSGMKFRNGDVLLARITPCLEHGKTAYVDFLDDDQVAWGSTEYIVLRSRAPIPPEYAYFLARSEDFRAHAITNMTGSSGRQRVPASSLAGFPIVYPPAAIAQKFGLLATSAFAQMKSNDEQSRTLAALRDTLLPKLMSGELRVRDAEKLVGAHV
ncbi:MAG: restriction endonuclease subunit S [Bryobacteraceae bacterium]|jgi:type I restriction enzyme S subunit